MVISIIDVLMEWCSANICPTSTMTRRNRKVMVQMDACGLIHFGSSIRQARDDG